MKKIPKFAAAVFFVLYSAAVIGRSDARILDERIYLEPVEGCDTKVIAEIKSKLPSFLPMAAGVRVEETRNIPEDAYDPARKQYDAKVVLDSITRQVVVAPASERALAIIDKDLCVSDSDFVLGAADEKRGTCVVSITRLKNEFYGAKENRRAFFDRAIKESMRWLGASWGLGKCANPKCVMSSSSNIAEIDKKKCEFCHDCRNSLHRRYGSPIVKIPGM